MVIMVVINAMRTSIEKSVGEKMWVCLAKIPSGTKSVGFDTTSFSFSLPIFAQRGRPGASRGLQPDSKRLSGNK